MTVIQRYLTHVQSTKPGLKHPNRYVDKLQDFVKLYNNTINSRTHLPPNAVDKDNEYKVWETLYGRYIEDLSKPRRPPRYKVGQFVHISREKLQFEKGEPFHCRTYVNN